MFLDACSVLQKQYKHNFIETYLTNAMLNEKGMYFKTGFVFIHTDLII